MPLPFHRRRLDPDAADFCRRSGATDRAAINAFVKGVKELGLWDKMVCWPLRSSQNAGFGSTAYSLGGLGTYDGTLVNFSSGAWTADGITKANANEQINVTGTDATLRGALSVFASYKSSTTADGQRPFNCQGGAADNNYWQLNFGNNAAKLAYLFATRNSINANGTFFNTTGREAVFNYWGGARASTSQQDFFNGTVAAEQTGLAALNATGTPNVDMLGTNGAANARGTLSFAVALTPTLTAAQMGSLYSLYKSTLGASLGLPDYDPSTIEYAARSGATDLANIDAFVRGVKDLGLWDNMVCWPLRSSQNAGTGDTVHSLGGLGTFNGTRVNGPAWTVDGIDFVAASNTHITTTYSIGPSPKVTLWAVGSSAALTGCIISAWDAAQTTKSFLIIRKGAAGRYDYYTRSAGNTRSVTGANTTISNFASLGIGTQGANTIGTVNGVLDGTIAFLPDESGTQPVNIGIQSPASVLPYEGKIAFALAFNSTDGLTTAQQLSLHNLYKSTLGTGLGLP